MRFAADFRPKVSKNFRGRQILHSKSRVIAPKSMPAGCAQLAHDPERSPASVPSVGMLRHVRLRAICGESRTENFEIFSRPQNFSSEIARDRAIIPADWLCAALPSTTEVPNHYSERRHAVSLGSAADFAAIWTENFEFFRGRINFRPKSRKIAPISLPIGGTQPCYEPQRSPSTVPSVSMLRHVSLHAHLR